MSEIGEKYFIVPLFKISEASEKDQNTLARLLTPPTDIKKCFEYEGEILEINEPEYCIRKRVVYGLFEMYKSLSDRLSEEITGFISQKDQEIKTDVIEFILEYVCDIASMIVDMYQIFEYKQLIDELIA